MGYSPIFVKKTKIQKDAEVKNDSDVVMQNLNLVSPQNSFKATPTKAEWKIFNYIFETYLACLSVNNRISTAWHSLYWNPLVESFLNLASTLNVATFAKILSR